MSAWECGIPDGPVALVALGAVVRWLVVALRLSLLSWPLGPTATC